MPTSNERRSLRDLWQIGAMVAVVIWSTGCVLPVFSGRAIPFEAIVDTTPDSQYHEREPGAPLPESSEVVVVTYYSKHVRGEHINEMLDVEVVRPSGDSIHYALRMDLVLFVPHLMAGVQTRQAGLLAFAEGYWPGHRIPQVIASSPHVKEFRLAMYPHSFPYDDFIALRAGLREGNVGHRRLWGLKRNRGLIGLDPSDSSRPPLWPVLARDHKALIRLIETDKDLTQAHRTMVLSQLVELIENEVASRQGDGPDLSELTDELVADFRQSLQRVTASVAAADDPG